MSKPNPTKAAPKSNLVIVSRKPNVLLNHVVPVPNKELTWTCSKVTNLPKVDTNRPEVKAIIDVFINNVETVRSKTIEQAKVELQRTLRLTLDTAPEPADPDYTQVKLAAVPPVDKLKPDTSKPADPSPDEQPTPVTTPAQTSGDASSKPDKMIAAFPYFTEESNVKCYPLSPNNAEVVKNALEYFDMYHAVYLDQNGKPTADQKTMLKPTSEQSLAVVSLLNRTSMRLLITEIDDKKKPVLSLLMKPVYLSPYSISCIVEAHTQYQANKSLYRTFITAHESPMSVYDCFQFAPHLPALCTSAAALKPSKHTFKFQFVNVIAELNT